MKTPPGPQIRTTTLALKFHVMSMLDNVSPFVSLPSCTQVAVSPTIKESSHLQTKE